MLKSDWKRIARWFTSREGFHWTNDMNDFSRIGALLAQRREGHCLPQGLYNGAEAFAFDQAAIFGTSWLMAGFECELPKPGSYVSQMFGQWPVLIVRGKDGVIRAFHNSCRHRGSMICPPGSGSSPKLVCPYHRWTYELDGSLFAAMRMGDDFQKDDHGLHPVRIELVAGAMFICFSDNPPPFADFAAKLETYLAPSNLKDGKLAFQSTISEAANWKLVMENGRECYHCATGHPELARTFPVGMSKHFDVADDARAQAFLDEMEACGLATEAIEGSWWQLARFSLNRDVVSLSMDGQHVVNKLMTDLNGGYVGSMRLAVDPHCFTHSVADHTFMFSAMPIGPCETHVTGKWIVHKDAVEGVDYTIESLSDLWTRTNLQDKELAENNQLGVNSPGYTPGPYSPDAEMLALRFTDWYVDTARNYVETYGNG
jgi:glycine betaine catabolism A